MKSSTGADYVTLDHVRALAAFMVFAWHFTHAHTGYPVPFDYVPAVTPLALFDEGSTGVALFMTLSGYLFAKLLDGKSINYPAFLWNRALRLLPLLFVVIAIAGAANAVTGENRATFWTNVAKGVVYPTLPNGGWSITVELHFYIALPLLLWMSRKSRFLPLSILVASIGLRCFLYQQRGEIQSLSYGTIVGRIDQFVLGILAFQFRSVIARRHLLALAVGVGFVLFYNYFDRLGGLTQTSSETLRPLWIIIPTIEGVAYAIAIAWYDGSFAPPREGVSKVVGRLGEYSYSIYLLHFFVVFKLARMIQEHVMDISNFYVALAWAAVCFVAMLIPGYLSFRFIEGPFLKKRRRYVRN